MRALGAVVYFNSEAAWTELEMLPKAVLAAPPLKAKLDNEAARAAYTLDRLSRWEAGERMTLWTDLPVQRAPRPASTEGLEACARTLAAEGCYGKALAALSEASFLQPSPASAEALAKLHPAGTPPSTRAFAEMAVAPNIPVATVAKQLRSFPKGSAPGPSGLRPQHLLDALTASSKPAVLEQLAAATSLLASGQVPVFLAPYLAGARVFAVQKKDGGLRPIAVGEVLRRLTGKCLSAVTQQQAKTLIWPLQVGVGAANGAEAAVHTVRNWQQRNACNKDKVTVKVDLANAFNSVSREAVLAEVRQHLPQLERWTQWSYGSHSNLHFGDHNLSSQTGVQQGDPLGPLLFALAIHPVLKELSQATGDSKLDLMLFYLDDGVLAGSIQAVSKALAVLQARCAHMGLTLRLSKSELILAGPTPDEELARCFPRELLADQTTGQDRVVRSGGFELLGAPIGDAAFCAAYTAARAQRVEPTLAKLSSMEDPQAALLLLRHCGSYGKLVYSMRVTPWESHERQLAEYDNAVRECFASFTGLHLSAAQWRQAGRGLWCGGLGLRSTATHAPAAFLASCRATAVACKELDPLFAGAQFAAIPSSEVGRTMLRINSRIAPNDHLTDESPPAAWRQQSLSQALDRQEHLEFLSSLSIADLADLQSEMLPGASNFLEAPPCEARGLAMSPAEFGVELQRRLLMRPYDADTWCPFCDGVLDSAARHPALCPAGGDRTRRHHAARNLVGQLAAEAGLRPELEKPGLLPPSPEEPDASGRRPADIYLPVWRHGAPAALDLAISSPQRREALQLASSGVGKAAADYEVTKRQHLHTEDSCKAQGLLFVPMVAEPSGGWGPSGFHVLQQLAKTAESRRGLPKGSLLSLWLQKLSVSIRRAGARAVLRREPLQSATSQLEVDI